MSAFSPRNFPPNEFWDFSTRLHARDDVERACLALQDRHDIDVNVLLFCYWVAASGRATFRPGELAAALDAVRSWRHEVVLPLRAVRLKLEGDVRPAARHLADDLARVTAECELHAEHMEQLMLYRSLERPGTGTFDALHRAEDAARNLGQYFEVLETSASAEDRADFARIMARVFPDVPAMRIEALFA